MSMQIEEGIIAFLYRTMKHRIISSDIALSIISTIKRIVPETGLLTKKISRYSDRLRKSIIATETRINWKTLKEKRDVWENNSTTLCPEPNEETNLTLDDDFFTALEY